MKAAHNEVCFGPISEAKGFGFVGQIVEFRPRDAHQAPIGDLIEAQSVRERGLTVGDVSVVNLEMISTPDQSQRYPEEPPFEFKTDLARRLWELRQQNIAAGAELLDWDGLDLEMARRRGQLTDPDAD